MRNWHKSQLTWIDLDFCLKTNFIDLYIKIAWTFFGSFEGENWTEVKHVLFSF